MWEIVISVTYNTPIRMKKPSKFIKNLSYFVPEIYTFQIFQTGRMQLYVSGWGYGIL